MYHALLTNRYLTSRVIPLVAVAAVALCVALVIIVVSVMTGFLDMVRSSGRTLMGDVIVAYPVTGIPYYERLIEGIEALPEAAAATPVVDSWGLLKMPYPDGENKETETVQVWGIDPESFAKVTGYAETLYWRPHTGEELAEMREDDPRRVLNEGGNAGEATSAERLLADGSALRDGRTGRPGIVLGIHVSIANERQSDGSIRPMDRRQLDGSIRRAGWWMPRHKVALTVVPTRGGGIQEPHSRIFPVANEFFSGVFLIDDKRVMVPLEIAQDMLDLGEADRLDPQQLDPETGLPEVIGVDPARVTMVLVRSADGVTPAQLLPRVEQAYDRFREEIRLDPAAVVLPPMRALGLSIKTWEQQQAQFIGPIEKERELMRTLFSLVYLVCAGLVLSIFWAIVYEKTRDIGILRSLGASRLGISWIFLRYGLVVGTTGSVAGVGLAWLVVRNINTIHGALGDPPLWLAVAMIALALATAGFAAWRGRRGQLLPITVGSLASIALLAAGALILLLKERGGVVIWDPAVYYFTEIPNAVDTDTAIITMIGAVIFSLIGAFLPAAKAADIDPVGALRYE